MSAMSSDEARELFSAVYDGELGDDEQKAFDAALAADDELKGEWNEFRDLLNEAHALDEEIDGEEPDLLAGVQNKIRSRSRGRFYKDRFAEAPGGGLLPILMAGVMLLLVAVAWLMLHYVQVEPATGTGSGQIETDTSAEAG
jgi:anti-sigma factor RsiW